MPLFQKGTLRKAFAAIALTTAFMGVAAPQPAQASAAAAGAAAAATAAAAASMRAEADRWAQNAVIVNPSDQNIQKLESRSLVDSTTTPYIRQQVAEMNIAPGTKADDVTDAQRFRFMDGLKEKRLVAEMSSSTGSDAVAKGMSEGLSPYFAQVKKDLGYSGAVTLPQAQAMESRMGDLHWNNDTKPALEKGAAIGGGVLVTAGAIAAAIAASRRREYGY